MGGFSLSRHSMQLTRRSNLVSCDSLSSIKCFHEFLILYVEKAKFYLSAVFLLFAEVEHRRYAYDG